MDGVGDDDRKIKRLTAAAPPRTDGAMSARFTLFVGALALALVPASGVAAWGATGHRMIGRLATEALPPEVPNFLRTPQAIEAVGELAREPDRSKSAGKAHDSDRDPAHFVNLGDDGRVAGGPSLDALPPTREAYEAALTAAGADSWKEGWLPYAIVENWQQLTKDFAYIRVETVAIKTASNKRRRVWFTADLVARRALLLQDLGALAHYVGDGSQPLHVTVHHNGWGDFPNPDDFTQGRLHARVEGAMVHDFVSEAAVKTAMTPYHDCDCAVAERTAQYLATTRLEVTPLYQLQKDGAFKGGDARSRDFLAARLAAGASELRDMIIDAWHASAHAQVGWPALNVEDVEAGKTDPWDSLYGAD